MNKERKSLIFFCILLMVWIVYFWFFIDPINFAYKEGIFLGGVIGVIFLVITVIYPENFKGSFLESLTWNELEVKVDE